jgi:hypothetical protein
MRLGRFPPSSALVIGTGIATGFKTHEVDDQELPRLWGALAAVVPSCIKNASTRLAPVLDARVVIAWACEAMIFSTTN